MTPPVLTIPWQAGDDPTFLRAREWLVTNGLGGYASGTLLGIGTRRYHGYFIPNLPAPRGRTVLIPRLDEEVRCRSRVVQLGGAEFADDQPEEGETHRFLKEFRYEWQTPVWVFEIDGHTLEKRVVMPYGENTVYISYKPLNSDGPVQFHIRPYVAFHAHNALPDDEAREGPFPLMVLQGRYEVHFGEGIPALKLCLRPHCGAFVADDKVSRDVLHRVERDRGYDHTVTLHSPGYFITTLEQGESIALVASVAPWETLELDCATILKAEQHRVEKVLSSAPKPARTGLAAHLVLAADQFIIFPGSRPEERVLAHTAGEEVRTVVAGYHWFTDWGRDTMISLEGLTLCTGRDHEARALLETFATYVKDGLLPNLFPEGERTARYNTVDATFWYFHALDRYYQTTGDKETLQRLFPVLRSIIEHHLQGTHFGIGMDPRDGLIRAGAEGFALTWMDAKVDDWVVTPRRGKPVEIQALWYNALRLMAGWAAEFSEPDEKFMELARRAAESFNTRFWFKPGQYLFDVIDGEAGDDASLRPNQLFTISLRFPILAERFWRPVLEAVTAKLMTPVGLRTLAPDHKDYKQRYDGDLRARDAAYHQGTVWPWLIGHFLDAWLKVYADRARARTFLSGFAEALRVAGVGTLSEIFDAEPPYTARGCIAQAWSVAEVLRSLVALDEHEA
ncbi:MAG TPA: amylo-alpha-1,6-glucosidase [Candidatus Binatia bacterium]|jgi:predicted glycogen debranching enzyme|nr:amylo-alpha-1,6-glucosidase [Candidatus Binatia bacterium]